MIKEVHLDVSRWNTLPWKFEAGTPAIAEAIGLGAAVDYLDNLGMPAIQAHEHALVTYAMQQLQQVEGLRILGPDADHRGGVVAFTLGTFTRTTWPPFSTAKALPSAPVITAHSPCMTVTACPPAPAPAFICITPRPK